MKILIGIPTIREYKPFWESMRIFLPEIGALHEIEVVEVKNKPVAEARNIIVDKFIDSDKDYLLFLDDDHSEHTADMVAALILSDAPICAMKCYSRFFPHLCTLMGYSGLSMEYGKYKSLEIKEGYHPCDLVGFGMTIIKRELFSILQVPYFVMSDSKYEDNYFCEQLEKVGVKPTGCFDYVCTHHGVDDSNIEQSRNVGIDAILEDIKKRGQYNGERLLVSA